jgi:hypothetical protein
VKVKGEIWAERQLRPAENARDHRPRDANARRPNYGLDMKTIRSWVVLISLGALGAALAAPVARQNSLLTVCPLKLGQRVEVQIMEGATVNTPGANLIYHEGNQKMDHGAHGSNILSVPSFKSVVRVIFPRPVLPREIRPDTNRIPPPEFGQSRDGSTAGCRA